MIILFILLLIILWFYYYYKNTVLHLWTFKMSSLSAVFRREEKGVADLAFEMPNGVISPTNNKKTLICICSKSPNRHLYNCIDSLYKIQIRNSIDYNICIIDSNSNNFTNYKKISKTFPNVKIHYIKNTNYEYGAWKYAIQTYPDYKNYFCIQDSIIIKKHVDLNKIYIYIFKHNCGFNTHLDIKQIGIDILKKNSVDYDDIIDTNFTIAAHCSFIVDNKIMNNLFNTLIIPPTNKEESCAYERIFGIYFIKNNIITRDMNMYFKKIHGNRN